MEIVLLPKSGLRIKGKSATFAIDPQDKNVYDAVLLIEKKEDEIIKQEEMVLITGGGEYEIGGVKITGIRSEGDMLYSMNVDGVSVLIGKLNSLEKMQHKLKEHNIIVAVSDGVTNASFITSLAENVIMFYGTKAGEIAAEFGKETLKTMNKYSTTKDKLPTEVETILLANS